MAYVAGYGGTIDITYLATDTGSGRPELAGGNPPLDIGEWTFHTDREMVDVTPYNSAAMEFAPCHYRWWVDVRGFYNDGTNPGWFNRFPATLTLFFPPTASTDSFRGACYIEEMVFVTGVDGAATFTAKLRGSGVVTRTF